MNVSVFVHRQVNDQSYCEYRNQYRYLNKTVNLTLLLFLHVLQNIIFAHFVLTRMNFFVIYTNLASLASSVPVSLNCLRRQGQWNR